jgi:hypothetical protein
MLQLDTSDGHDLNKTPKAEAIRQEILQQNCEVGLGKS